MYRPDPIEPWTECIAAAGCPDRPQIDELEPGQSAQWAARGSWILDNGLAKLCPSQVDAMYGWIPQLRRWRALVGNRGHCVSIARCLNGSGHCPRTLQPCPRMALAGIINLWGTINGKG